jgi:hypothetical protein
MRIAPLPWLCAAIVAAFCSVFACGDNKPTNPGTGGSSSSGSSGSSGSGSGSGSGGSSGSATSSSGAPATDGGTGADAATCPTGLQDKVTTCSGSDPTCVKGCGPDMVGGVNNNLGYKTCSCNTGTMVYNCPSCTYPQPLPSCYAAAASPAACAAGVANKSPCTTPCSGVCTTMSDAGKVQGCVCVMTSAGATEYTCATQWW